MFTSVCFFSKQEGIADGVKIAEIMRPSKTGIHPGVALALWKRESQQVAITNPIVMVVVIFAYLGENRSKKQITKELSESDYGDNIFMERTGDGSRGVKLLALS